MAAAGAGHRSPTLGAAYLAAQMLSLNALSLITTAFIVRELGALQYGEWATASSLTATHFALTNVGLRTLFVREVARRPDNAGDLVATQLGVRLVLAVVAAAMAVTVCLVIGYPPIVLACMAVGAVWIVVSVIGSTLGDLLLGRECFGAYSAVGLAAGLAVTSTSVLAVAAGTGPVGLTIAYLTQPIVSASLLWVVARRQVQVRVRWNRGEAKTMLRDARVLGAGALAAAAGDRATVLLMPALLGLERFGVFSAGTIIADRLGAIPDAIATTFYPRVSRAAIDSASAAEASVATMLTVALTVCLPMVIATMYLAEPVAGILLPGATVEGTHVIRITALGLPLLAVSTAMSYSLQAAGRHDRAAKLGIVASLTTVGVSAAALAAAGTAGGSWAIVARPGILAVILARSFHATFPGTIRRLPGGRLLIAAAAYAVTCHLLPHVGLLETLAAAGAGLGLYVAALLLMRVLTIGDLAALLFPGPRR